MYSYLVLLLFLLKVNDQVCHLHSVYWENFHFSLPFKFTLECGHIAALSVFSCLPYTESTQLNTKFRLLPPPSADHMQSSLQPQVWPGRSVLLQH